MAQPTGPFIEFLLEEGYAVAAREDAWCEVFVARANERFLGRGLDTESALADLRRAMFPSAAAQALLDVALAQRADVPAVAESVEASTDAPFVTAEQVVLEEVPAPPEPAVEPAAPLVAATGEPAPAMSSAPPAPTPPVTEASPPGAPRTPPTNAGDDGVAGSRRSIPSDLDVTADLAIVSGIQEEIERGLNDLGMMSPERQRMEMLWLITRARACFARTEMPEVHVAVAKVAKRLGDLAKILWPGNVKPLQLMVMPWEVVPRGRFVVEDWTDAADAVDQLRRERKDDDARSRRDAFGWADADRLRPRADDAALLFKHIEEMVKKPAALLSIEDAERAAATLRWLRGDVPGFAWGSAAGRLRQRAHGSGSEAARLRELLDASFRPPVPWQEIVEGPSKDRLDPSTVRSSLPPVGSSKDSLAAWLQSAVTTLETTELTALLAARRAEILALGDLDVIGDRRARRRWRDVRSALDPQATTVPPVEQSDPDGDPVEADVAGAAFDALVARVREQTTGKRAMFVTNREDKPLHAKLEAMLGLSLTWYEATPRRVQAACDRIVGGGVDFVLSATGFQDHKVDDQLSRAAKSARVAIVRVNRGRPVACVLALARELGIDDEIGAA